jgi:hypothetical protein
MASPFDPGHCGVLAATLELVSKGGQSLGFLESGRLLGPDILQVGETDTSNAHVQPQRDVSLPRYSRRGWVTKLGQRKTRPWTPDWAGAADGFPRSTRAMGYTVGKPTLALRSRVGPRLATAPRTTP